MDLSGLGGALLVAGAMGVACSVLSVFVVLRRWAFIGEGIGHAGFGGAGVAWLLSLALPSIAFLREPAGVYCIAAGFCVVVALAIGWTTRRGRVHADTAIGIFLVASLAIGFIAYQLHVQVRQIEPGGWREYLFGQIRGLAAAYVIAAVLICAGVVAVVALLGKEIVYYCFDAELAELSGVRVGVVHYLLIVLVTLIIIIGMRLTGPVLVTALLVLPGATGLLVSRRMRLVMATAITVGLVGALAGPLAAVRWPYVPEGPAIVLVLVGQFAVVYLARWVIGRRGGEST